MIGLAAIFLVILWYNELVHHPAARGSSGRLLKEIIQGVHRNSCVLEVMLLVEKHSDSEFCVAHITAFSLMINIFPVEQCL